MPAIDLIKLDLDDGQPHIRLQILLASITFLFVNACVSFPSDAEQIESSSMQNKLAKLEISSGGRIGLSAINTGNNMRLQYHADERFPLCSTFKAFAVAAILKRSMKDSHFLQKHVVYSKGDVAEAGYSPITKNHIAGGMSIAELSAAAIQYSDNAAANLLMKQLGGPAAVTAFVRTIVDESFRLDRWEPDLNSAVPGDLRDTSTPVAIEKSLHQLLLGDALAPPQRDQFQAWLKGNTTGDARIRAGVPKDWIVGDKTGTCSYGTTNDVGIIWSPKGAPIVVAIYFTQKKKEAVPRDDVVAAATQILVGALN